MDEIYQNLAAHLEPLTLGFPPSEDLMAILQETFSPQEARAALAIPNRLAPLEVAPLAEIAARCDLPADELHGILEDMARRGTVFSAPAVDGGPGYSLLQVGYGMPQTFFWGGQSDERAQRMARLVYQYFRPEVTRKVYGERPTKVFKYSPAALTVEAPGQGVYPFELMEDIVNQAQKIAVAHCPCRLAARILGRDDCQHSLEVCFKYDELAEFVIAKGLARPVSADETLAILAACEKEGLVHMVDNAASGIKHTCNCCGHYCWNVGLIKRRKVPRDRLMASYFLRVTDPAGCIACGACEDICPVAAVRVDDQLAHIDEDWCIGCGVCMTACPTDAISMVRRVEETPPDDFMGLMSQIRRERDQEQG